MSKISRLLLPVILTLFLILAEIIEDLFPLGSQTTGRLGPQPLVTWDKAAFLLINVEYSNLLLDPLMKLAAYLGSVFWFGSVVYLAYKRRQKEAFLLLIALSIDSALNTSLKLLAGRVRPYQVIPEARVLDRGGGFSFPSGHSEASFLSATFLAASFPRKTLLFYLFSSVIAYSRIYVGAHWPLDVVAGTTLGCGVAVLILLFGNQILRILRLQG
ncbi:MAG: phosphatase PAP2 family protein [Candidatus Bathyarchaeia archaeon]